MDYICSSSFTSFLVRISDANRPDVFNDSIVIWQSMLYYSRIYGVTYTSMVYNSIKNIAQQKSEIHGVLPLEGYIWIREELDVEPLEKCTWSLVVPLEELTNWLSFLVSSACLRLKRPYLCSTPGHNYRQRTIWFFRDLKVETQITHIAVAPRWSLALSQHQWCACTRIHHLYLHKNIYSRANFSLR